MNFIEILKKAFMDNWTGGASIDPRTGQQGDPGRYHGKGAFDDLEFKDLFDKNRWVREDIGDPNPKSDRQMQTSYYHPRPTGESMRSYIEDQRSGRNSRTFPMGNGPSVTDPGLQRGFQDWPGINPQGRPYDINPNPEGRNPDNPAHRYHPGASGAYNPAAGQAARAVRRPSGVRINPDARSVNPHGDPGLWDSLLYWPGTTILSSGHQMAGKREGEDTVRPDGSVMRTAGGQGLSDAPTYGGRMSGDTTRTIVQNKDGTKETVVTKTPNPETSMTEIMKRLRELQDMRAR